MYTDKSLSEGTGRRRSSSSQGERPQEKPTQPTPGSGTSSLRAVRQYTSVVFVTRQPELTETKGALGIGQLQECSVHLWVKECLASPWDHQSHVLQHLPFSASHTVCCSPTLRAVPSTLREKNQEGHNSTHARLAVYCSWGRGAALSLHKQRLLSVLVKQGRDIFQGQNKFALALVALSGGHRSPQGDTSPQ